MPDTQQPAKRPPDLRTQLRDAWLSSGLSLAELATKSKVGCSSFSLGRKLSGEQTLRLDEACALVRVLGLELRLLKPRQRAA
jgi:hypothetical protein